MTERARRRPRLAAYAAIISISAYAGAAGLATGTLATTSTINSRLPFHSPAFGGLALALVVGIPTTAVAWCAWRDNRHLGAVTAFAGVLLIAWIVVELAYIRELSWLQLAYVVVGASFVTIGGAIGRREDQFVFDHGTKVPAARTSSGTSVPES